MKKTKPFTNMFGREVQVTEVEYAMRWHDKLSDLGSLFIGSKYQEEYEVMLRHTLELAAERWQER